MVILVRCQDDSIAPALQSHLDELACSGLITAYLTGGRWVAVEQRGAEPESSPLPKRLSTRPPAIAAGF
ncbi:hypothetical protein SAMN06269301_2283 [Geobacter sp. DSM 9736]|nr:hypothetical protein SAMN06269301_2283 [Geobacter sp. DSM 9736]